MRDPRPLELPIISRRKFVHSAVAASGLAVGGLALSLDVPAQERAGWPRGAARPPRDPAAFLQIGADDVITIISPAVEMGQGGHTSLPMIIVEELGGRWDKVRVMDAAAAPIYRNPMFGQQSTVGSFSVRGWYTELRRIGAAARTMLVAAAARRWRVPEHECSVVQSEILHSRTARRCSFGSVARLAAKMPVPQQPALKQTSEFKVIGTSPPRVDIRDKVDGSARYGIDAVLPDMLHAAIRTSPTLGGKLKSFDDSACRSIAGYEKSVALPDGVVVIARSYWQARKALERLRIDFDPGPLATLTSAKVSARLREGFDEPGTVARNDGNADAALARAAKTLEAVYEVPYLAHATMEPMNCTARVTSDGCEVWCGTQSPQSAQAGAAKALGIPPERVKVHTQYLGGGFGRRGEADYVVQAVTAAKATDGRPVKLIWSREEDIQHDFYRPAAAVRFRGGLDGNGRLVALDCKVVTASAPAFGRPGGPPFYTEGISDANYQIPNFHVSGVDQNLGVRFGFWRSVNDSHNPFMLEGFIDELAREAKQDPYLFRRTMLQGENPNARRQLALLDLLAAKSGWQHPPAGHALGITALSAFGSFVGAVAEVSMQDQIVTLHRVALGIDCGVAVHPDNIAAQCEGGMVFGLTAALRGEITLENGAVMQSNFHDYPVLQLVEMPLVDCYIMPSTAPPGGVGEPSTATIAPALANAIYAASNLRLRSLPMTRHQLGFRTVRT